MSKIVDVEVIEHKGNGIIVKILDDSYASLGRIRPRELSWNQSVSAISPRPEVGEKFKAKVIRDKKGKRYVDLSIRQLTDPWEKNKDKYKKDQVVRGEIVNIRNFGAFVQIEPGIVALVRPKDIPLRAAQLPHTVLAIGDQVQGVITKVDKEKQEIAISLTKHLQELSSKPAEKRRAIQLDLLDGYRPLKTLETAQDSIDDAQEVTHLYHPAIPRPKKILIVDDEKDILDKICEYIESKSDAKIVGVQSGEEAIQEIKNDKDIGLVIIDINLKNESGQEVAEDIHQIKPDLPMIFMSGDPERSGEYIRVDNQKRLCVEKEFDFIVDEINRIRTGYWEKIEGAEAVAFSGKGDFIHQLGMTAFAQRSLLDTLSQILSSLRNEIQVTRCMIFEVDSVNKKVSLLAAEPPLEENIEEVFLDGLYYSPVQNVVEDELNFYRKDIYEWNKRFKRFRPIFPFKTCYGVPLKIPGLIARHALFVMDDNRIELDQKDMEQTRLTAHFMQSALERSILLKYMRRYEKRYSRGQLLDSFVHELKNKLDSLGALSEAIANDIQKIKQSEDSQKRSNLLSDAREVAEEIAVAQEEMVDITKAYQSMASGKLEAVDVNEVVQKIKLQLKMMAFENKTEIYLDEQSHVTLAKAIKSRLEQIVTNLTLNAIQQIFAKLSFYEKIRKEDPKFSLEKYGQVILKTQYIAQSPYPIQILVIDTGPGIHYQQQKDMFLLDTTTRREGHGLGLYHSRNLIERMGGRIRLLDSLMFIGSSFVIELPKFQGNGK